MSVRKQTRDSRWPDRGGATTDWLTILTIPLSSTTIDFFEFVHMAYQNNGASIDQ